MNCNTAQKLILLEESGEISASQLEKLARHAAACAACRESRAGIRVALDALRAGLPSPEPSPGVMAGILSAARARPRRPALLVMPAVPRLLAWAALFIALLAAGRLLVRPADDSGRIEEVGAITAMMGHEPEVVGSSEQMTRDEQLAVLARQLLNLEGLQDDEASSDEWPLPDEEPAPKDLQSRNASASRPA